MVINEISGVGAIVRYIYMDSKDRPFWAERTHSLLYFQLRPELGNTGVRRLLDLVPEIITGLLSDCQKGLLPDGMKPSSTDIENYVRSIDAIQIVIQNRP